jgi:CDP-diacylglycerol---glycerol-3-phosphate 3-phosphatidyltransferase
VSTGRFGPSALATPANGLTMARVIAAPVIALLTVAIGPTSWVLWSLWTVFTLSDKLDGYVARRHGTTRAGIFLDPLADKLLVLGALSALAALGTISVLPLVLIAGREIAMSAFRSFAGRRGISVPARPLAKLKTLVQDLTVAAAYFPPIGVTHKPVITVLLWVSVAFTLVTGAQYFLDARRILHGQREASDKMLGSRAA